MTTKTCARCKETKDFSEFYQTGKNKSLLTTHCKTCHKIRTIENNRKRRERLKDCPIERQKRKIRNQSRKFYNQQYVETHRELYRAANRKHYWANRQKISELRKQQRDRDPIKYKEEKAARRKTNLYSYRLTDLKYVKNRRAKDPSYRIAANLRVRLNAFVKKRSTSMKTLVGCEWDSFRAHLESLFKPEMSWENYGTYWEIDHIQPCCSFDLLLEEEQKKCFHWSNCRPLEVKENVRKGATEDKNKSLRQSEGRVVS